ncbi:MAG: YtxH domain-containing protein [Acidobacteriales bacterium]|nr:YtxH domain-containing protein [Terriglobales bacterium]
MARNDGGLNILWFVAGIGVGALAGVLYAPQAGEETREELWAKAEAGRDFVRERTRGVREQASDWAERGKDVLNQQKEQFRSAYEAGKQAYQEATAGSSPSASSAGPAKSV